MHLLLSEMMTQTLLGLRRDLDFSPCSSFASCGTEVMNLTCRGSLVVAVWLWLGFAFVLEDPAKVALTACASQLSWAALPCRLLSLRQKPVPGSWLSLSGSRCRPHWVVPKSCVLTSQPVATVLPKARLRRCMGRCPEFQSPPRTPQWDASAQAPGQVSCCCFLGAQRQGLCLPPTQHYCPSCDRS